MWRSFRRGKLRAMRPIVGALSVAIAAIVAAPSFAGTITEFNSRSSFSASTGASIIDDYGAEVVTYPDNASVTRGSVIYTGANTAFSSLVTQNLYGTGDADDQKLFFRAGEDVGGFATLELSFEAPVSAFGFDSTGFNLDDALSVEILFSDGSTALFSVGKPDEPTFFAGFESTLTDIAGVRLYQLERPSSIVVAIDNLAVAGDQTDVPEPGAIALLGLGALGLAARRRARTDGAA